MRARSEDTSTLSLRPLRREDEVAVRAAQEQLAPDFVFAFDLKPETVFADYVELVERWRQGRDLNPGWVPTTYLLGEVAGQVVGRISLRHTLSERLRYEGGHIGFGVLPAHRQRGYATAMLRASLPRAAALGHERVLLTCDESNLGSRGAIEACGGVHTWTYARPDHEPLRHYWITL